MVETLICLGTPCTPHLVKLAAFLGMLCFGHDRCRSIGSTTQQQYQVIFLCSTSFQYVIFGLRVRYTAECDVVFPFLGLAEHIHATTEAVALNGSICRNMWRYQEKLRNDVERYVKQPHTSTQHHLAPRVGRLFRNCDSKGSAAAVQRTIRG